MVITDIDFKIAPEGATHYSYATGDVDWYKLDGSGWHIWLFGGWGSVDRSMGSCVNEIPVDKPQNEIDLDVSGQLDKLLESIKDESEAKKEKIKSLEKGLEKLSALGYEYHQGEWLSKEEIEKQVRLEAAYDLYCEWNTNEASRFCFNKWKEEAEFTGRWLRVVDKTGYRKGEL